MREAAKRGVAQVIVVVVVDRDEGNVELGRKSVGMVVAGEGEVGGRCWVGTWELSLVRVGTAWRIGS